MKKLLHVILLITTGLVMANLSMAQCPDNIQINIKNKVDAECPSTGEVSIGSNCAIGSLKYVITSSTATSGFPTTPQNDSTFRALPAGDYTIRAYCASSTGSFKDISLSIADHYTPMTNVPITVTSTCNSGSITIGNITGGKTPFQYSVITQAAAGGDPNYADSKSQYSNQQTFTSLAPGIYIVRVKDACSQYLNFTEEVLVSLLPPIKLTLPLTNICSSTSYQAQIFAAQNASTGTNVDITPYLTGTGLTVNVYDGGTSCTKGNLLATYNYKTGGSPYFDVPKATNYYVETITPCSTPANFCVDASNLTPTMKFQTPTSGCAGSGSPVTMDIMLISTYQVVFPITVTVKNSLGNEISGSPFTFYNYTDFNAALQNLPHDNYEIDVKDDCHTELTYSIQDATTDPTPQSISFENPYLNCITQTGTSGVTVKINGYIADLKNADSVKIISGPSNVGIKGYQAYPGSDFYSWDNMLPGTYQIRIYTKSCGNTELTYTLKKSNITPLKRNIQAMATSFCGGTGRVEINTTATTYNGAGVPLYVLINNDTKNRIDSSATGSWTNLPKGNYAIAMKIVNYCDDGGVYEITSNVVTITGSDEVPAVTKKVGVICEDANGLLLTTGIVYLELAGGDPLRLEYKLATDPDVPSSWLLFLDNAPSAVSIPNLTAYAKYDIRVSNCKGSTTTQVSVGKLDPVNTYSAMSPCIGQPYTISADVLPGATYTWKNSAGSTVSNSYRYDIVNYDVSYDGAYTCTVVFGTCVTRKITVTLDSKKCGQTLPIRLTGFAAVNSNCKANLSWTAIYSATDKQFEVERSSDGKNFISIATLASTYNSAQYSYTDQNSTGDAAYIYYRLKMIDMDGSFIYSKTIQYKCCNSNAHTQNDFIVIPNPAKSGQSVKLIYSNTSANGYYNIVNVAGQAVQRGNLPFTNAGTNNTIQIQLQNFAPGVYIINLITSDNKISGYKKVVVY